MTESNDHLLEGEKYQKCPNCNDMKIEQACYSDGLEWLHCLECGWIDPTTNKPEIIGDWG